MLIILAIAKKKFTSLKIKINMIKKKQEVIIIEDSYCAIPYIGDLKDYGL